MVGAALVGGTLASVPGIAWAAPRLRPNAKRCKTNSQCQSGNCADGVCREGCPTGTTECDRRAGEGLPGKQCVPNCPEGQVLNTLRCQCVEPTEGTNLMCICGDGSERLFCNAGSTCPDDRTRICMDVCGGAGVSNTICSTPEDIC